MSSYPRSNPRKSNRSGLNVNNGGPWNPKLALKENNLWLNFEAQDFASEVSNKHAFKTWRKKRSDFFYHSSTLNLSLVTCIFYVLSPCTVYIKLSNFILFSLENDDMESSKHCVKLLSLIFIIRCFTKLFLFHKERSVFRHVSASHLQNDCCLNLAFDPRRKNDNFQLFHPGHTYKRQNALCLTKILFIKVSMLHRFCLVIFYFKEKFCVSHASASHLQDVYCLKLSKDLVEKIISLVMFDTNRSFKQ